MLRSTVAMALMGFVATPALAGPTEDFRLLQDRYWAAYLKDSPFTATSVGVQTYDRELDQVGLAEQDRQAAEAAAFLAQLDKIPAAALPAADQANYSILHHQLANAVESNSFGSRALVYGGRGGLHNQAAGMAEQQPFRTRADYDNYLARIALVPDRMAAFSAMSVDAAKRGYTQPCVTMTNFEGTISGSIAADPAQSRFYAPFAGTRPTSIGAADWAAMQKRARDLIAAGINPSYQAFAAAYGRDIKDKCRTDIAITALPDGKAYYDYLVRYHTTTDMTPEQIHALGLKEVARIRAEMDSVAGKAGFASREAMIADMRTNPKYFAKTPEELLEASSRMAKTLDGKMPTLFGKLPRLPYGVKPIPAETADGNTTAYYNGGSPDAGLSGTYFVNTTHLDQRPLWELPALTAHEAVPGHHNQIALQQELDQPAWRKYTSFFTAFTEGWGLYSERLGIEMGLYDTPQKDMGRLSYEMWRACRLVVDTGLHAKGWSKDKAVKFMKDNTALTDANIDAEVNRYISGPGQALAYKIGELKIRELRALSEKQLGDKFDVRRFHDAVLGQGSIPLDTLEAQIKAWIEAEKARG
ncbi:MAG: DUF885 domain-containing protein [Sphingomicrobium sp.]